MATSAPASSCLPQTRSASLTTTTGASPGPVVLAREALPFHTNPPPSPPPPPQHRRLPGAARGRGGPRTGRRQAAQRVYVRLCPAHLSRGGPPAHLLAVAQRDERRHPRRTGWPVWFGATAKKTPATLRMTHCTLWPCCSPQGYTSIHHEAFALGTIASRTGSREIPADDTVVPVSAAALWHAVQQLDVEARGRLFPCNLLLVDWMPYDVSEQQLLWMERSEGRASSHLSRNDGTCFFLHGLTPPCPRR